MRFGLTYAVSFASACGLMFAAEAPEPSKYTGPGSCSSPSCHGGVQAREITSVLQNEYSTWVVRDKHAHAFINLTNPVGTRIAKIMGLGKPDTAPRCLACHALDVPVDMRARTFDLTDGVGCENCHGPASAWLGPHTTRDWKYEKSLDLGMYNTRDLIKRSEKCLTCHLGTGDKSVDHELIAAGHPDLYFELDSFMSVMPQHWKEFDKDPWLGVRSLGVGQAVQLREQLKRIARESQGGIWPEYAELDCFACHHSLTAAKDSWRQERGYPGRRPGNPPWNLSRYVVFRRVIQEADPGASAQLRVSVDKIYGLVTALNSDRKEIASEALSASQVAESLAQKLTAMHFDQAVTLRLLKGISSDAEEIAEQGERSAEQATMALDSLFIAYSKNNATANDAQIRAGIHGLFQQLEDPSAYNGFKFAQAMKSLNGLFQ
ncbi:MAG TPA: multiheme c-type cytochrome [Bryobacteraceae bacterium]|nr:multiheme c-type cytochrome [Bryobacteraceae bacterium]